MRASARLLTLGEPAGQQKFQEQVIGTLFRERAKLLNTFAGFSGTWCADQQRCPQGASLGIIRVLPESLVENLETFLVLILQQKNSGDPVLIEQIVLIVGTVSRAVLLQSVRQITDGCVKIAGLQVHLGVVGRIGKKTLDGLRSISGFLCAWA